MRTDLNKCNELIQRLQKDAKDSKIAAVNQKELIVMQATLTALKGDYSVAKNELRDCM